MHSGRPPSCWRVTMSRWRRGAADRLGEARHDDQIRCRRRICADVYKRYVNTAGCAGLSWFFSVRRGWSGVLVDAANYGACRLRRGGEPLLARTTLRTRARMNAPTRGAPRSWLRRSSSTRLGPRGRLPFRFPPLRRQPARGRRHDRPWPHDQHGGEPHDGLNAGHEPKGGRELPGFVPPCAATPNGAPDVRAV
jgi:hypothetical protein